MKKSRKGDVRSCPRQQDPSGSFLDWKRLLRPLKLLRDTGVVNPGARIGQCLNQLRVQRNLSVVGEQLGDGTARLGVAGSLVERFLAGPRNRGRRGQRN